MPFWAHLTPAERDLLLDRTAVRAFGKGELLHSNTGECLGMVTLLEGRLRTMMVSDEGREITLYTLSPGETDVLSASCVISQLSFDTSMTADTDSSVIIVPAGLLSIMKAQNIHLNCYLMEVAARRFSEVMWTMQQILFRRIDARIADLLLRECESGGGTALTLTHEGIARDINSAREVVARVLRRMQEDGLLVSSRGRIVLKDPEGLRALTL